MDEREQLVAAREQLKSSIKAVYRDLKLYGVAVVNRNKAILKGVGNNVVNAAQRLNNEIYIHKCNREAVRIEREREKAIKRSEQLEEQARIERNMEHKRAMAELLNEQDRENRMAANRERRLNFNKNVKQKVSSVKSKLGNIKNSILNSLNMANIDVKIRNAFDNAQIIGLNALNKGVSIANNTKNSVVNFTSDMIAKYYNYRLERQRIADERRRQADIKRAEQLEEQARIERNMEHQRAMEELLNKHDKLKKNVSYGSSDLLDDDFEQVFDSIKKENERRLNFNKNVKQKVSSVKSKLGNIKNSVLNSLNMANIDVKIRNAFDNAQIFGLSALNRGVSMANNAKDSVVNFSSDMIAKYYNYRLERQRIADERKRQADVKRAEQLEEKARIERNKEHKKGMTIALNEQERDSYNAKHDEMNAKKQELIQSLKEEKNRLLGLNDYDYIESNGRSR